MERLISVAAVVSERVLVLDFYGAPNCVHTGLSFVVGQCSPFANYFLFDVISGGPNHHKFRFLRAYN
jgi:hypothetical protein